MLPLTRWIFVWAMVCGFNGQIWAYDVLVTTMPKNPLLGQKIKVILQLLSTSFKGPTPDPAVNIPAVTFSSPLISLLSSPVPYFPPGRPYNANAPVLSYSFEIITNQGELDLLGMKVTLQERSLSHDGGKITFSQSLGKDMIFIKVEASAQKVYLREGFNVKYYLYSKFPLPKILIKQYPRMSHFLKRFNKNIGLMSEVEEQGEYYFRYLYYEATLFPLQTGTLTLDAIKILVNFYLQADPQLEIVRTGQQGILLESEAVAIQVSPLPALPPELKGVDTGLVGDVHFSIANLKGPMQIQNPFTCDWVVRGQGALELLDVPEIYSMKDLDSFGRQAQFQFFPDGLAEKIVTMSYIPQSSMQLPESSLNIITFDAQNGQYRSQQVTIPTLQIAVSSEQTKNDRMHASVSSGANRDETGIYPPIFAFTAPFSWRWWHTNVLLALMNVAMILWLLWDKWNSEKKYQLFRKIWEIKYRGITYQRLYQMFSLLQRIQCEKQGVEILDQPLRVIILNMSLGLETRNYFLQILAKSEQQDYSRHKESVDFTFQRSYFEEIKNLV